MKWEDLPADIQRQIRAGQITSAQGRKVPTVTNAVAGRDPNAVQPQRGLTPPGPPQPRQPRTERWRCRDCGLKFTAWQTAQNHGNEKGHVRIELILPGEGDQ